MAAIASAVLEGGLVDPVFGSQAIFRRVMDAFANPGRVADLGGLARSPAPLGEAAAAFLAALADYDTPVWFEEDAAAAAAWLTFHTGAPVSSDPAAASFAILAGGGAVDGWQRFAIGTESFPDRSATLLLPVAGLTGGPILELQGPGIETSSAIAPEGLPPGFADAMAGNRARFPLGFDVLLVCGPQAAALPRTTHVREA